jgi:hypothetical protein
LSHRGAEVYTVRTDEVERGFGSVGDIGAFVDDSADEKKTAWKIAHACRSE